MGGDIRAPSATMGGKPATITVSLDYLMTPTEDQTATDVANLCQEKMQNRIDELALQVDKKSQ